MMSLEEEKNSSSNPPEEVKLTVRQEAFIKAYSVCKNGAEAARQAGYATESAHVIASRLLRDVRIKERINREIDYDFESWCRAVKGIVHDENAWQAKLKGLELYGKARGWLRENITNNNFLSINHEDLEKIRNSVRERLNVSDNIDVEVKSKDVK